MVIDSLNLSKTQKIDNEAKPKEQAKAMMIYSPTY